MPVEEVVTEYQGTGVAAGEIGPYDKGVGYALGPVLDCVFDAQPEPLAVAKELAVEVDVFGTGDDEDLADIGQHEHRERVVDHRLVEDRQELFGDRYGQGVEARALAAGEDDALHGIYSVAFFCGPWGRGLCGQTICRRSGVRRANSSSEGW